MRYYVLPSFESEHSVEHVLIRHRIPCRGFSPFCEWGGYMLWREGELLQRKLTPFRSGKLLGRILLPCVISLVLLFSALLRPVAKTAVLSRETRSNSICIISFCRADDDVGFACDAVSPRLPPSRPTAVLMELLFRIYRSRLLQPTRVYQRRTV